MSHKERLQKVRDLFPKIKCDALLVDDSINLFYLTGFNLSTGKLLIDAKTAYLMVDARFFELCQRSSQIPVILTQPTQNTLKQLLLNECKHVQSLAIDATLVTYRNFLDLQKTMDELGRTVTLIPTDCLVKKIREIKDAGELKQLRAASVLGSQGFDFVCTRLREGVIEEELAAELEIFWRQKGGSGVAFDPIIAFGASGSMPHYRAGKEKLQKGQAVLIDIGVTIDHYHSDMTRMAYFGKPTPKMAEIHKIVQEAQQKALEKCKPGTLIGELDRTARDFITAAGYGEAFVHRLGHGVGLEIHEWPEIRNTEPFKDKPLQAGMVITVEPGIYLPNIGGVRIEDTIAITQNGYENLTNRPKDILIINR